MDSQISTNSQKIKEYLLLALFSLVTMLVVNRRFLSFYFQAGWPAGWDASAHFTISQLYYESHWPKLDGRLESFFQGFYFPRFYPPLFYLVTGFFYWLFPSLDRVIIFKSIAVSSIVILPVLVSLLAKLWQLPQKACYLCGFLSTLFLSTTGELAYLMPGLDSGIETGLITQALGIVLFVCILIFEQLIKSNFIRFVVLTIFSWGLFYSNYHVVVATSIILFFFLLTIKMVTKKIDFIFIFSIISGFLLASPWYLNVIRHASSTPSIPVEGFGLNSTVYGCLLIAVISILIPILFKPNLENRFSLFNIAIFLSIPILNWTLEPFGIKIGWQPHRLISVANTFLPILIANGLWVIGEHLSKIGTRTRRIKLSACVIILILCLSYNPKKEFIAKISESQTSQIKLAINWLKDNPSDGYFLVPFARAKGSAPSLVDIALSHYLTLSKQNGIWGVLRESSFNSIFSSELRNLVSFTYESYGIPSKGKFIPVSEEDLKSKVLTLPRWGVTRLIIKNKSLKDYKSILDVTKIEYQNKLLTILKLPGETLKTFSGKSAHIFVGQPIDLKDRSQVLDFAQIAIDLTVPKLSQEVILLFDNCDSVYDSLGKKAWQITCGKYQSCCNTFVRSTEDILNSTANEINIDIENISAKDEDKLIVAPWRSARLQN